MKRVLIAVIVLSFSQMSWAQKTKSELLFEALDSAVMLAKGKSASELYNKNDIKTLAYFSGGITVKGSHFRATLFLDLNDLIKVTKEGKEGFVTYWIDFESSLGFGKGGDTTVVKSGGIGLTYSQMTRDYHDPLRSGKVTIGKFNLPFLQLDALNFSGEDGSFDAVDASFSAETSKLSVSLFNTTINLKKGEVNVDSLYKMLERSFSNFKDELSNPSLINAICPLFINGLVSFNSSTGQLEYAFDLSDTSLHRSFSEFDNPNYSKQNSLGISKIFKGYYPNQQEFNTYVDKGESDFQIWLRSDDYRQKHFVLKAENIPKGWHVKVYENNKEYGSTYPLYYSSKNSSLGTTWRVKYDSNAPKSATVKFGLYESFGATRIYSFWDKEVDQIQVTFFREDSIVPEVMDVEYVEKDSNLDIRIEFSENMNVASVQDALTISGEYTKNFTFNSYFDYRTHQLLVKVYEKVKSSEKITVKISTNAQDFAGNALKKAFVDNYSTKSGPTISVDEPISGNKWRRENTYEISWQINGKMKDDYNISLIDNNGFVKSISSGVKGYSYYWTIPNSIKNGSNYSIVISNQNKTISDTSGMFSILDPLSGHDLELDRVILSDIWIKPGKSVKVNYVIRNVGKYNEQNYTISFQLVGENGQVHVNKSVSGGLVKIGFNVYGSENISPGKSIDEGHYVVKVNVKFSDDFVQGNNTKSSAIYIGNSNPYATYKTGASTVEITKGLGKGPKISGYQVDYTAHDGKSARMVVDGGAKTDIKINNFSFFDAYRLMLTYRAYYTSDEAAFDYALPSDEIKFSQNKIEIEAGKKMTLFVKSNEEDLSPQIKLVSSGNDDYEEVIKWDLKAHVLGRPFDSVLVDIKVPINTPIGKYSFWVQFSADGKFLQKLEVEVVKPEPDFVPNLSTNTLTLAQGSKRNLTLSFDTINGFDETIAVNCEGLPNGVTCTFDTNYVNPPSNISINVTIDSQFSDFGTFAFILNSVSNSRERESTIYLNIVDASQNYLTIDSVLYIDEDQRTDSLRIFYTSDFSLAPTAVTSDWQYLDASGNWIVIDPNSISGNSPQKSGSHTILWKIPIKNKLFSPASSFKMRLKSGDDFLTYQDETKISKPSNDVDFAGVCVIDSLMYVLDYNYSSTYVRVYEPYNSYNYIGNYKLTQVPVSGDLQIAYAYGRFYIANRRTSKAYYYTNKFSYIGSNNIYSEIDAIFELNDTLYAYANENNNEKVYKLNESCGIISGTISPYTGIARFAFSNDKKIYVGANDDIWELSQDLTTYSSYILSKNLEFGTAHAGKYFGTAGTNIIYEFSFYNPYSFYASSAIFILNNTYKPSFNVSKLKLVTNEDQNIDSAILLKNLIQDNDDVFKDLSVEILNGNEYLDVRFNNDSTVLGIYPKPDYNGISDFIIQVNDNYHQKSLDVELVVQPVNDPPISYLVDTIIGLEDENIFIDIFESFFDIDQDPLKVTVKTDAKHKDLVSLIVDEIDNFIIIKPELNFWSQGFPVFITVTDPVGAVHADTVVIILEEVNDAPLSVSRIWPKDDLYILKDDCEFKWTESADFDFDQINYSILIRSGDSDSVINTKDTTHQFNFSAWMKDSSEIEVEWTVLSEDSLDFNASSTGSFKVFSDTGKIENYPVLELLFDSSFCPADSAYVLSGGSPIGGNYYIDGNFSTSINTNNLAPGIHEIRYYFKDKYGFSNSIIDSFEVYDKPEIGRISGVDSTYVDSFENYMVIGGNTSSFKWNVEDGVLISGSDSDSIQVKWPTSGSKQISTFGISDVGCLTETVDKVIRVKSKNSGIKSLNPTIFGFPNPVDGSYQVIIDGQEGADAYSLYSYDGKLIKHKDMRDVQRFSIDFTKISSGLYFIEISINGKGYLTKVYKY